MSGLEPQSGDSSPDAGPAWLHGRTAFFGVSSMVCIALVLFALLFRVGQLQIAPGDELASAVQQRQASLPVPAWRGEIHDRRGRVLATSTPGFRVFLDPWAMREHTPEEFDWTIIELSEAIDRPAHEIGERLMRAVFANDDRAEVAASEGRAPRPIRYIAFHGLLTPEQEARVRALELKGVHLERRQDRVYPGGEFVASIVGLVGFEHEGRLGAEHALEPSLRQRDGAIRFVRDADNKPMWVHPRGWRPGESGRTVRLSLDLELQRIAYEELSQGVELANAAGGRLVLVDTYTGGVLAMVDIVREVEDAVEYPWVPAGTPRSEEPEAPESRQRYIAMPRASVPHPAMARNRCVEDVYEPGSTFKPFVWAGVTELGLADPEEIFQTHGGRWRTSYGRRIEDVTRRDQMSWADVLVHSSNIGMVKASERMSDRQLHGLMRRFGFGQRTGIGLPGESPGIMTPLSRWNKYTHTSVAFGYEVAVTPIQMVRAFCAFARPGDLAGTLPVVRLTESASPGAPDPIVVERVLDADVATLARRTMERTVQNMERGVPIPGRPEDGWQYRMFGKSGTANIPLPPTPEGYRRPRWARAYFEGQFNSSFIAGAPLEQPRLAVLVVIDDPGPDRVRQRRHYGSWVAGPVARRVLERSLGYMGVPPDNTPELSRN
ncbi:MAG: penicillin-binding protein 2 [Phycisphaerales bacterium]|nr:penicillin-binding protein 2 [Phycisphaerales bacterium]